MIKEQKENGRDLVQSCKGVDCKGKAVFVLLGEKEGKMKKRRTGKKKRRRTINHTFPCVVGS